MNELALAWRLARRELRGGLKGFRVFIASLALGVAAIAGVGGLSESVIAGLRADGARLLGGEADLRLHNRPATEAQRAYLRDGAGAYSEVVKMRAMARPAAIRHKRALVELKAVDRAYPLIGTMRTEPATPLDDLLARRGEAWGAVADANLLVRLGLGLGDKIRVGAATFEVRATVVSEPDRVASVFSLGPRLMVSLRAVAATELVQPGSQIHYHYRLTLADGVSFASWQERLTADFPSAGWRIRGTDKAAPGVERFVERMTLFLSFVGLTVLLVGGLGVGSAVGSYLDGKTATIATLKCLGAPSSLVFKTYMLQVLVLGALGVGTGLIVGGGAPLALIGMVGERLPVRPVAGVYAGPILVAAVFGLLAAATFAVRPVARAQRVRAAGLFRHRVDPAAVGLKPGLAATVLGAAVLAVLTVFTVNDRYFAYWFIGGALLTLLLLRGGAALVMAAAGRLRRPAGSVWRLVRGNIHRRGGATPNIVLSLGLGLSVLVAIALIEGNMRRQIEERLPERAPAFFFIDIQPAQVAAFDAAVTGVDGTGGYQRVPTVRGRIVRIAGLPVEEAEVAADVQWAIRGDRALTYAARRPSAAKVVDGKWWAADYTGPPVISLDAGLAHGFGIGVGDTLTLNVLGRDITARVTSLREIDWRSLRFDFAIIFAPGTLEAAPHTHIAAIEAEPAAEEAVERAATDPFPNISAIRVRDALEAAARILAGINAAVTGTAALTLIAGAVVLAGVIASEHHRRVYDAVVFKVLGASRRRIVGLYLLEYGVLGLVTGVIAAAVGTLTAWAVIRFLMRAEWIFLPGVVAVTTALCLVVTLAVGLAGTWAALGHKAAPHLRNE